MQRNNMKFSVLVDGRPVYEYRSNNRDRFGDIFIEGRKGHEYSLKFENSTNRRVKGVFAVDGLNVITGDNTWERGYIIEPYGSLIIDGWRKNDQSVNAFYFAEKKSSYSARAGKGSANVGVIGAKVFFEKLQPIYSFNYHYQYPKYRVYGANEQWKTSSIEPTDAIMSDWIETSSSMVGSSSMVNSQNSINSALRSAQPVQKLGTGYGEEKSFKTETVYFNAESSPAAEFVLFYDDRKNLERMGIKLDMPEFHRPNPFPTDGVPPPLF